MAHRRAARSGFTVDSSDGTLRVSQVEQNRHAYAAGLRIDDRVTALNGTEVSTIAELKQAKADVLPGDIVSLQILRGGETLTISFEVQTESDFPTGSGKGSIPLLFLPQTAKCMPGSLFAGENLRFSPLPLFCFGPFRQNRTETKSPLMQEIRLHQGGLHLYCPEEAEYRLAESAGPPEGPAKGGEGRNDLRMRPKFLLCPNLTHFLQILFRAGKI